MLVRRILAGALVGGMVLVIPASAAFAKGGGEHEGEGVDLGNTLLGSCENEPILKLLGGGDVLEVNLLGLGVKALDEGGVLTVDACDED